jgi:hypothetical protein
MLYDLPDVWTRLGGPKCYPKSSISCQFFIPHTLRWASSCPSIP